MGQVYRARDTKLHRDVALKILPEAFALDGERIARFRREAQVLAALNHSHIAQIYGLEEATGTQVLVLELVDGESLDKRLARGPVPVDEALGTARQMAEALKAAHEKGIVHRDLKPANIALTRDGQVKVLDFGLAKAIDHANGASLDVMNSPTITSPAMLSNVGVILGTAAYMSPEQAKGRPADKRSDVWAFGCIVFEMLTGRRAFAGEDVSDTLASVLRGEPDWRALPTDATHLTSVLKRCLEKDPEQRLRDIADVKLLLETAPASQGVPRGAPTRRTSWMWATMVLSLIAGGASAALLVMSRSRTIPPPVTRFEITSSQQDPLTTHRPGRYVAISPDGSRIVYTAGRDAAAYLVVRQLDQLSVKPIPGSDGAVDPFFSPDGQRIGFAAHGELRRLPVGGGQSVLICRSPALMRGATWGPNDSIVFAATGVGLFRVPAGGGDPVSIAAPDRAQKETNYMAPSFLPGGRALVYTAMLESGQTRIMARALDGGMTTTVVEGGFGAQYLAPGYLIYGQGDRLMAVPFDVSTLKATGSPVVLQEGVSTKIADGVANVATASDGTGVYVSGGGATATSHLIWVDRHGIQVARIVAQPLENPRYPRLSPDGRRLALSVGPTQSGQIWIYDLAGSVQPLTLTFQDLNLFPIWSPDGTRILFASSGQILSIPADGSATEPQRLITHQNIALPRDWSPGVILFEEARHLHLLDVTDGKTRRWLQTPFEEGDGRFSPDGHWLAYTSNQSGSADVWVRPFPGPGAPVRVSPDGGHDAVWSRDGTELFYRNDLKLLSARVVPDATFRVETPRVLFEGGFEPGSWTGYDVAPDGRFVMIERETSDNTAPSSIVVIRNWRETLGAPEKR
jgi:serine/threonine protein kinase/Tol biopolymer transport system component